MRLSITVVIALFAALSASAVPVITSVSPNTGPAGGGTTVTITGTGFTTCIICSPPLPPAVLFGGTPAPFVTLVSSTTIEVVTPPHVEGVVTVTVDQYDGFATKVDAFTYTGDMFAALEPILFPVFAPPVRGQFGSEFHSSAAVLHKGERDRIMLFGLEQECVQVLPIAGPFDPLLVEATGHAVDLQPGCSPGPGRVLWVPAGHGDFLAFNARVRDVSRSHLSHGTEIPIVRASDLTTGVVALLKVPAESRFRNTLRIYALQSTSVLVTVDQREYVVPLQPGSNRFEPAYSVFTDFPTDGTGDMKVTVEPLTPITSPPTLTVPIWAFITVTNNETQEITTISPN